MPRNLIERCEVVFPVTQPELAKRLREEILGAYLKDNTQGAAAAAERGVCAGSAEWHEFSAQDALMALAMAAEKPVANGVKGESMT